MGIKKRHLQSLKPVFKVISMSVALGFVMFVLHSRSIAKIPQHKPLTTTTIDEKVRNILINASTVPVNSVTESTFNVGISEYNVKSIVRQLNDRDSQSSKVIAEPSNANSVFVSENETEYSAQSVVQSHGTLQPAAINQHRSTPGNSSSDQSSDSHQRVILLWNAFFTDADFGLEMGEQLFENMKYPKTCRLTADRSELPTADAVIVHAFHLLKDLANASIPRRVSQKQIFVFLILENPYRSYPGMFNLVYSYMDIFNLTMTYLNDPATDIYTPYGGLKKRIPPEPFAVPSLATIRAKTKKVVWLVSNCQAPSARYEYVDLLSKHIEVDIFGKCGEDTCPKGEICLDLKDKEYLFYLAFENGYCKDYITEKTFRTLGTTSMVPVVLGGGNYTRYLPRHSFIDVRDFNSPKELAVYLNHLSENRAEYMRYLLWKKDYIVVTTRSIRRRGFCRLCGILNEDKYPYKSRFDPLNYWAADLCLMGDDEREAVHIF